tara:strand:+ start:600 stop:719 length:120 start_codon:yes stop_codon:yes gene_type:complete
MKSICVFILLVYWSVLLLAPVVSKENKKFKEELKISLNK